MATVIDTLKARGPDDRAARHPEKQNRPDTPVLRKPEWLRVRAPGTGQYNETKGIVREHKLTTVCEEAACPNIGECWSQKHATMMIMGEICTRACAFCNVTTGLPTQLDPDEPRRVAEAVAKMGLKHVVITSVDRDDLLDGGARHFAEVVTAIDTAYGLRVQQAVLTRLRERAPLAGMSIASESVDDNDTVTVVLDLAAGA